MANPVYILKSGKVVAMIGKTIEKDPNGLERNQGFSSVLWTVYKLTVEMPVLQLDEADVENPIAQADSPRLVLYGAITAGPSGSVIGYEGDGKSNTARMSCLSDRGRDFMRWGDFVALLQALNIDTDKLGAAQPKDGGTLQPVYFRVKALEGKGAFVARNVATAWGADRAKFDAEDAASASLLSAGASLPTVGSGIPGLGNGGGGVTLASSKPADAAEHAKPAVTLKRSKAKESEAASNTK